MKQLKPGYILFLLFSILSLCAVLISLYFSQVVVYRQLMQLLIRQEKTKRLAYTSTCLLQALITPDKDKKEEHQKSIPEKDAKGAAPSMDQTLMFMLFDYWNKKTIYKLIEQHDGLSAELELSVQSEQGKLNLNSLYDFEKKKFLFEGQPNDCKKLCTWLFEKIATITKKPSLFSAFEQHLKNRKFDFNDVTELLSIKEFSDAFTTNIFLTFSEKIHEKQQSTTEQKQEPVGIFLTDIFTVSTEQSTINPWLFSHSWCKILDLKPKQNLSDEEKKKTFAQISKSENWDSDWNKKLKDFYQKDYKDLSSEIKTILTTEFEANIFSLLLKANIGETNSTNFTIVKAKAKDRLINFEIIKNYQI